MFAAAGNFVRFIVFARLLRPFDFGVAVGAFISLDVLSTVTESYLMGALVQQREEADDYLDTVWVVEAVRALLIAAVLILAAKPLAAFFRQEDSYRVFWMAAVLGIVREMQSPGTVRMFRELEYRNMLVFNVAEFAATLAFGTAAILILKDWRGLMIGAIAGQVCWAAVSYAFYPYWPKPRFSLRRARKLFRFGKWMSAARTLEFMARRLDSFAVGHLLGPALLGAYKMALNAGEAPMAEFAGGVAQSVFPMVARLSKTRREKRRVILFAAGAILIAGIAYGAILIAWGGPLLVWIFGEKWIGAVGPLRFLCFYGLFDGLVTLAGHSFEGIGTPAVSFTLSLIRASALAIFIYPLIVNSGISGAACAALISAAAPLPFAIIFARKATGGTPA